MKDVGTDRLFVPLKSEPWYAFSRGEKRAEFRGVNGQFNRSTVYTGRDVELRRGYSTDDSLWATVAEVAISDDLSELVEQFYDELQYDGRSIGEIAYSVDQLVGSYDEYIVFSVDGVGESRVVTDGGDSDGTERTENQVRGGAESESCDSPNYSTGQCATWRCESERLPHMSFCYEHVPRCEIPTQDGLECPECGELGPHGTIHDDLYYCKNDDCGELFDPRRTDYLWSLQAETGESEVIRADGGRSEPGTDRIEITEEGIVVKFEGRYDTVSGWPPVRESLGLNPAGPEPVDGVELVDEEELYYEDEDEYPYGYGKAVLRFEDTDALERASDRLYSQATEMFEWGHSDAEKVQDFAGRIPNRFDVGQAETPGQSDTGDGRSGGATGHE